MIRTVLSDAQWDRIKDLVPSKVSDRGVTGRDNRDNRLFVEAVLWVARTGAPWRDLPAEAGHWNSPFRRFSRKVVNDQCSTSCGSANVRLWL